MEDSDLQTEIDEGLEDSRVIEAPDPDSTHLALAVMFEELQKRKGRSWTTCWRIHRTTLPLLKHIFKSRDINTQRKHTDWNLVVCHWRVQSFILPPQGDAGGNFSREPFLTC